MLKTIICRDVKGQEHSIPEHEMKFRPSVYALIMRGNSILMIPQHQEHYKGFDLPGGGVELDETLEQAVIREVKEETGFDVTVGELVWATTSFFRPSFGDGGWNAIALFYVCTIIGGELSKEFFDEYEKKYADLGQWIDFSKLDSLPVYTSINIIPIIKKAQQMVK